MINNPKKPSIKFSHYYDKLVSSNSIVRSARLLYVQVIQLENLSQDFLNYDTDNGKYNLPKYGTHILLLFEKGKVCLNKQRALFTTLRRYTIRKYEYYKELEGKEFEIQYNIKEKN